MARKKAPEHLLEIDAPSVACGSCRFTAALTGAWSVEDGRLVWRGAADPQPGRGPDLFRCCESDHTTDDFTAIKVYGGGGRRLSDEDVAALRAAATEAQERERAEWEAKSK